MTEPSASPLFLPKASVEDPLAAVEELRASDYQSVPADLLKEILATEQSQLDDRATANRAVGRLIDEWLIAESASKIADHVSSPMTHSEDDRS